MVHALTERHLLPVSTLATGLTCIGGVHFDQLVASLCRFAYQLGEECGPRRITDRFCQTMVVNYPVYFKVFDADDAELVHDTPAMLVREILTPPFDPLMDSCHGFTVLASFWRTFGKLTMLALHFCQGFFFCTEEARVLDFLSIREGGKGLQPNINAHGICVIRQALKIYLTGKAGIPFTGGTLADRTRLGFASQVPMEHYLDFAHLGNNQLALFERTAARDLGKGDGVVALLAFEARIAGLLSGFASAEKGLERQIDAHSHILQNRECAISREGRSCFSIV